MSRQPMDLTNQRFGRLVALSMGEATRQGRMWLCRCDCGVESLKLAANLSSGHTRSCGCLYVVPRKPRPVRDLHGQLCTTHQHGVAPGHPPFFNLGCPTCEAKKAAGKVRGDEGPAPGGAELRRMTSRWVNHAKVRAARRKAVVLPYAERGE